MRKTGSNLYMYDFSVDYNIIVVRHRIMFKFIKQAFISLLSFSGSLDCLAKLSDQTKCISLNNEPCLTRPSLTLTLIMGLRWCNRSYRRTFDDLSSPIFVPNKTKDVNLNLF